MAMSPWFELAKRKRAQALIEDAQKTGMSPTAFAKQAASQGLLDDVNVINFVKVLKDEYNTQYAQKAVGRAAGPQGAVPPTMGEQDFKGMRTRAEATVATPEGYNPETSPMSSVVQQGQQKIDATTDELMKQVQAGGGDAFGTAGTPAPSSQLEFRGAVARGMLENPPEEPTDITGTDIYKMQEGSYEDPNAEIRRVRLAMQQKQEEGRMQRAARTADIQKQNDAYKWARLNFDKTVQSIAKGQKPAEDVADKWYQESIKVGQEIVKNDTELSEKVNILKTLSSTDPKKQEERDMLALEYEPTQLEQDIKNLNMLIDNQNQYKRDLEKRAEEMIRTGTARAKVIKEGKTGYNPEATKRGGETPQAQPTKPAGVAETLEERKKRLGISY